MVVAPIAPRAQCPEYSFWRFWCHPVQIFALRPAWKADGVPFRNRARRMRKPSAALKWLDPVGAAELRKEIFVISAPFSDQRERTVDDFVIDHFRPP